MVTQELINYIKTQKQQNVTDEAIIESLLKRNWSTEDINQAFLQINTLQISAPPTIYQSSPAVPSQKVMSPTNNINIHISTEKKPRIIKIVSLFIFLIASLYVLTMVQLLGIIIIIERSFEAANSTLSFLKNFPTFGIIPIMFSLVSFFFFYLAFKIRNGSKFSLWLSISSLIIIPPLTAFISQILISPLAQLAASYGSSNKSIPSSPLNPSNLLFDNLMFILVIISVILIAISFKKFHFRNDPISNAAKVFLASVVVILIIPTLLIISLDYFKTLDTDFGYTKAKTTVGYHIYKPISVPNGMAYASKFITGKELAGKQNAVQVAYDIPFEELRKGRQSKLSIVQQVYVEPGFNLEAFATTFVKDSNPQKIFISKAVNQTGFLIQKPLGNSTLSTIVYLTSDNILIMLVSPKVSPEELTQLAESLE